MGAWIGEAFIHDVFAFFWALDFSPLLRPDQASGAAAGWPASCCCVWVQWGETEGTFGATSGSRRLLFCTLAAYRKKLVENTAAGDSGSLSLYRGDQKMLRENDRSSLDVPVLFKDGNERPFLYPISTRPTYVFTKPLCHRDLFPNGFSRTA